MSPKIPQRGHPTTPGASGSIMLEAALKGALQVLATSTAELTVHDPNTNAVLKMAATTRRRVEMMLSFILLSFLGLNENPS